MADPTPAPISDTRKSSQIRTKRGSRVSLAPATDQSVVSYYHSNHAVDPPTRSSRKSVRLSLAQQQDTFVSIYKPEEPAEGAGDAEGGRQYMFEYGKDNPAPKIEKPSWFEMKKKAILHHLLAYKVLFFIQMCCAVYIAVKTLAPFPLGLRTQPSESQPITPEGTTSRGGFLVDFQPIPDEESSARRTYRGYVLDGGSNLRAIVCSSKLQLFFIGLTRISAYSMYPCKFIYMMVGNNRNSDWGDMIYDTCFA